MEDLNKWRNTPFSLLERLNKDGSIQTYKYNSGQNDMIS